MKLLILICCSLFAFTDLSYGFSGNGAGTSTDPYQITTCTQLQEMENDLDGYYVLASNVNCFESKSWNSGSGFSPVGTSATPFTGSLDGQNYTITNLFINRSSTTYVGLFGQSTDGVIKNIIISDAKVIGEVGVGILIGRFLNTNFPDASMIENCHVSGEAAGRQYVGGLAGRTEYAKVSKSSSTATVTEIITGLSKSGFGGLIGFHLSSFTVTNSYASGSVIAPNATSVGGLIGTYLCYAGCVEGNKVYASGSVIGNTDVGGLYGTATSTYSTLTIADSFAVGFVNGASDVSGIVPDGNSSGKLVIQDMYFDATTTGQSACIANGDLGTDGSCTGVNSGGSQPSYFIDTSSAVFANWDFTGIWKLCDNSYPKLLGNCTSTLSSASLSATSLETSASNQITFSFTLANKLSSDGRIVITFPEDFDITNASVSSQTNIDGDLAASVSNQILTLTRSGGSTTSENTAVTLKVSGITNPSDLGQTGSFSIKTTTSDGTTVDQSEDINGITLDCQSGRYGASCLECPGGADNPCSGHGACDDGSSGTGLCSCDSEYYSSDCSELVKLTKPTLRLKAGGKNVTAICNARGNISEVVVDSYTFFTRVGNKKSTLASDTKSIKVSASSGQSVTVKCQYDTTGGLTSKKSRKKTVTK